MTVALNILLCIINEQFDVYVLYHSEQVLRSQKHGISFITHSVFIYLLAHSKYLLDV